MPCRFCDTGNAVGTNKNNIIEETAASKRHQAEPYSSEEEYEGKFSVLFRCNSTSCGEIFVAIGDIYQWELRDYNRHTGEEEFEGYEKYFKPVMFRPSIDLFRIEPLIPKRIAEELRKAFSIFFTDNNAAANRIRVTVEYLLSELKVPTQDKRGKRYPLHERIMILAKRKKEISNQLLAIKWIGNSGSHMEELSRGDVIDALEILEHTLHEIFVRKYKILKVKTISAAINSNKGPRR